MRATVVTLGVIAGVFSLCFLLAPGIPGAPAGEPDGRAPWALAAQIDQIRGSPTWAAASPDAVARLEALAERCGMHRTYIGGIERGERNVSVESIQKIAHALGVRVVALFKGS